MAQGHNLKDLYEKISEDSKNFLRSHVKKRTDSSRLHQEIILTMNNSFNVQFSWDIDKLIEESCNAFDNWRYAFESKEVGWFAGYNEIRNAILERINWLEKDH